jgi:hypothetical protein
LRKEFSLAILAVVLALIAVQGASLLQNSPAAAVMKATSAPEPATEVGARLQMDQSADLSTNQTVGWGLLVPLAVAALCYLIAKNRM